MKRFSIFILALVVILVAIPSFAQGAGDGRYMIKFRNDGNAKVQNQDMAAEARAVEVAGGSPIYRFQELDVVAAWLPEAALRALENHPNVEYIEVDQRRYPMAQTTPYGIPMVQAPQVTFNGANAASCKVCIIDSGYYMSHEDLQDSNVTYDTDSGTGDPLADGCGHGTHVAGTIAALNNTTGVLGVVPSGSIKLHIVKVFANDCSWKYSSDLINALNKCKTAGSKVVSMSLGGTFSSNAENTAFSQAYNEGVLSIAAAGNDGSTRKSYPASYASVVSVAAIDSAKLVADFSQKNDAVELAAPGVAVLSTVPWKGASLTVSTDKYLAAGIAGSKSSEGVSGATVNGGRCSSVGSWSGKVVLCERGDISFKAKVDNVAAGGGVAAAIYNNVSGGFAGTCDDGSGSTCNAIPGISMSQEDGQYVVANQLGLTGTVVNSTAAGSGYEAWDGTSMATPHVSGVAALVWSNFPSKTNVEIRQALQSTAEDLGSAGKDNSYGYGLVRAKAAYDLLAGGTGCTDADGDGFCATEGDCNDSNAAINPGATEVCDGVDNDCDGTIDEGCSTGGSINLSASGYKVKGVQNADLTWSGATSTSVDIFRSGAKITTTANDGFHTDNIGKKGGGSYTYKVCEAGTSTCSNEVTVSF